jgi:hypothetical protein
MEFPTGPFLPLPHSCPLSATASQVLSNLASRVPYVSVTFHLSWLSYLTGQV